MFLFLLEQIFQNIKQEYSRYQRWRHLEVVLNQSEACTSESQPHSSALTAPSSPGKQTLVWTDRPFKVCKWYTCCDEPWLLYVSD